LLRKSNKLLKPFVKWAGGKRQIAKEISRLIPPDFNTYYEPFVGGGAILLTLQPPKAVINDFNPELMNVYKVIKDNVEELIEDLRRHINTEEYFYKTRELDRNGEFSKLTNLERASRIIYLNKTCYNGLFRVNNQGQFNVPFGNYKDPDFVNEHTLRAVNHYLNDNKVIFHNCDFEESLKGIKKGDFVYFDPPYDPISDSSSFTGYTLNSFSRDEQVRLKETCDNLNNKGIRFLLSNSSTEFIKNLYREYQIVPIKAPRMINSIGDKRGRIEEYLIRNY
jgi:DNA adenine methylase